MRTFSHAGRVLGALEERVMNVMWDSEPLPVREVARKLRLRPAPAYTTVMTTLDRLYKKGLLARSKDGNAFVYRPAMSRAEYHRRIVESAVGGLLEKSGEGVLAAFVDTATKIDEANLSRLERLIAEKKRSRR